jgi:hypothetical protein
MELGVVAPDPISSWYSDCLILGVTVTLKATIPTEHAEARFASTRARSEAVLRGLEEAEVTPDLIVVNECPVRAIREVMENGEDVYLGDIAIDRWTDGRVLTVSAGVQAEEEEMARYAERNIRRMVGDPKIVWHLGGMSQNASLNIPYASTY